MKTKAQKQAEIDAIKEMLNGASGVVLVDFCGLTVDQDTDFRRKMREAGVKYGVFKNTLISKAAQELGIENLDPVLSHNTALAVSAEDAVAPAKVVSEFAKKHEKVVIKAGLLDGKVISLAEVKELAALPSKEVLIAKMLGSLNAPISGFVNVLQGTIRNAVYVLEAVRKQKEESEKASA